MINVLLVPRLQRCCPLTLRLRVCSRSARDSPRVSANGRRRSCCGGTENLIVCSNSVDIQSSPVAHLCRHSDRMTDRSRRGVECIDLRAISRLAAPPRCQNKRDLQKSPMMQRLRGFARDRKCLQGLQGQVGNSHGPIYVTGGLEGRRRRREQLVG